MENVVELLNYYSKNGIPQLKEQQAGDSTDEGNLFGCVIFQKAVCFNH